jgi:hypothetical protein
MSTIQATRGFGKRMTATLQYTEKMIVHVDTPSVNSFRVNVFLRIVHIYRLEKIPAVDFSS